MRFELLQQDDASRLGKLHFLRGEIQTPVFMPRSEEHTSELQSQ